jgi:hypothetical protein
MARRFLFASAALLGFAPAVFAQQFTYNASALPVGANIWADGVTIADVNGDGALDIMFADAGGYATGTAAAQRLYKNNGAGLFTDSSASLNVGSFGARQVIAEDFDNDGDLDLLYSPDSVYPSPNKKPVLLINNGSGVFTNMTNTNLPNVFMCAFCVCAGDVDNDGDLDVVFTDGGTFGGTNAQAHLYLNNGSAVFTDATATNLPADLFKQQDVILLDVDNDYDIDIAITGKGGNTHVYLNDGTGHYTMSAMANAVGSGMTYEIDWGDLDGDGDFDAAVQSITSANEGWARNDGTSTAMVETTFTGNVNNDDNEMALLDYDNDGDLDVVVASLSNTGEQIFNNNNAVFTRVAGVIQIITDSSLDIGIGDLNNDGKYDLVTAQGESGTFVNKVYMNNGSADTIPPVFMHAETPAGIGASSTVFRAQLEDQFADDGHIPVTASYAYTTVGAGSGGGTARHMGNGLFRASVPSAGATSISLTWTATDKAGNVSNFGPIVVNANNPWSDEGRALAGVSGAPALVGTGSLLTGSAGSLTLSNAAPSAAALMFVSLSSSPVPFKGGQLCAFPFVVTLALATDGSGGIVLPWASWPSGLSGLSLWFQIGISDGAAIHGVALSNTERGDVP